MKLDKIERDHRVRLNRYIAQSGLCNRRDADILIAAGEISVDGKVVTEMGIKVDPRTVKVEHNGKTLKGEFMRYVLLNKPKGYRVHGKGGRNAVALVMQACKERVYAVGELHNDDMGLLLFTNDALMAQALAKGWDKNPSLYHITCSTVVTEEQLAALVKGVPHKKGHIRAVDAIHSAEGEGKELGLSIVQDDAMQVRMLLDAVGVDVIRCDRVLWAGLSKKDIPRGTCRMLSDKEVSFLRMAGGSTISK